MKSKEKKVAGVPSSTAWRQLPRSVVLAMCQSASRSSEQRAAWLLFSPNMRIIVSDTM